MAELPDEGDLFFEYQPKSENPPLAVWSSQKNLLKDVLLGSLPLRPEEALRVVLREREQALEAGKQPKGRKRGTDGAPIGGRTSPLGMPPPLNAAPSAVDAAAVASAPPAPPPPA